MAYPKRVWVKLNRPEGEVNLRDRVGRDIGDIPEGIELTVTGIDAQGRYTVEAFIASSVVQDTDPKESTWVWPVGNPLHRINHKFNEPRTYGNKKHEGVDLEARLGDALYAVQAGIVRKVWTWQGGKTGNNAYGNWLIIEHDSGGYSTMYCHMQRFAAGIVVGKRVNRGQEIGKAGSTGNSTAAHLHLTVTHPVLGLDGYVWPKVVNPEPLLANTIDPSPTPVYATLPEGHALKGLHGPADPGEWAWDQYNLLDIVRECSFESVKVLCPGTSPTQVQVMRDKGAKFIYARLFAKMDESRGDSMEQRAMWFFNEIINSLRPLYNAGLRYVEVHNEPNLTQEGLGINWNNGVEFAVWFSYVVALLKLDMPQIKCGFPGLSPGGTIIGVRQDSSIFFTQAQQAVSQADWLGFHSYYGGDGSQWPTMITQINSFADANRGKVILVSEWSNNSESASKDIKGQQYKQFYAAGKAQLRPNVGALNVFVLWSSGAFQAECLVEKDGTRSAIVAALA